MSSVDRETKGRTGARRLKKSGGHYHHGNLRTALVEASLRQIEREGVERLSLRKVAARAGVTHPALYAHFADKAALIAAVKDEGFRLLLRRIERAVEMTPGDPFARLRAFGDHFLTFAWEHTAQFRVMFENNVGERRPEYTYIRTGREIFALLRETIGECAPGRDPATCDLLALAAWSLAQGFALLALERPLEHIVGEGADTPALGRELVRLFSEMVRDSH